MFKKLIIAAFVAASLGGPVVVCAKSAAAEKITFEYGGLASSQGKAPSSDKLGGVKPFIELAEVYGELLDDPHHSDSSVGVPWWEEFLL